MRKLLYPAALLLVLTSAACRRDEKECDVAKADQLHEREVYLNQREQALNAREAALAAREAGNKGGTYASGASYETSTNAGYAAGNTGTRTSLASTEGNTRVSAPRRKAPVVRESSAFTGTSSAHPGQFPEASERVLTDADVAHLSAWGRKVMLSEIYARHHYVFPDKALQKHFNSEYWYQGREKNLKKIKLSAIEKQNIAFLQ